MLAFRYIRNSQNIIKTWRQRIFYHCLGKNTINLVGLNGSNVREISTSFSRMGSHEETFRFTDYDCIGFDLDNTLARYRVGNMIEMEYDIISNFLVKQKGYPAKYLLKPLDRNFIIKGLIIDDENGNLIRISPEGKIIQSTHGTKWLDEKELLQYYPERRWQPTDLFTADPLETWNGPFSEKMRTLLDYFDICVSLVYARAVDAIDEMKIQKKNYEIWPDMLEALVYMFDKDHFQSNTGEFFVNVKKNPELYYYQCSKHLLKWLEALREKGKHLFLITGAHVDFASHTAAYTIGPNWRDYFDIVVCYAKKPGFFTVNRNFMGLHGFEETVPLTLGDLDLGGMYTLGNWGDLKKFLKKQSQLDNPKFLYIGDNLVQDIYTPNVHSGCDTVMVCEELEAERTHGLTEHWHPDEQFLISSIWGSYFRYNTSTSSNNISNWCYLIKKHSKLCVPSLEYVASFPIEYEFKPII